MDAQSREKFTLQEIESADGTVRGSIEFINSRVARMSDSILSEYKDALLNGDEIPEKVIELLISLNAEKPTIEDNTLMGLISRGLELDAYHYRDARALAAHMVQYAPKQLQKGLYAKYQHNFESSFETPAPGTIEMHMDMQHDDTHIDKSATIADDAILMPQIPKTDRYKKVLLPHRDLAVYDKAPMGSKSDLYDTIITNYIEMSAFVAWLRAYRAVDTWRMFGFKHNPILPILGINKLTNKRSVKPLNSHELDIAVHVPVLGGNVLTWKYIYPTTYTSEINAQIENIKYGLTKLSVTHMDLTDRNFVLHFDKDESGEPDTSRPPKVFLIDWEYAIWRPTDPRKLNE